MKDNKITLQDMKIVVDLFEGVLPPKLSKVIRVASVGYDLYKRFGTENVNREDSLMKSVFGECYDTDRIEMDDETFSVILSGGIPNLTCDSMYDFEFKSTKSILLVSCVAVTLNNAKYLIKRLNKKECTLYSGDYSLIHDFKKAIVLAGVDRVDFSKYNMRFNGISVKAEPKQCVDFIKPAYYSRLSSDINSALDKGMRHGKMLYGKPGVGKSTVVSGIVSEITTVPVIYVNINVFMSHNMFDELKSILNTVDKAVVVLEDFDCIPEIHEKSYITKNALEMLEMNVGVVTLATVNNIKDLDAAVTRTGRFDEKIKVHAPRTIKEARAVYGDKLGIMDAMWMIMTRATHSDIAAKRDMRVLREEVC